MKAPSLRAAALAWSVAFPLAMFAQIVSRANTQTPASTTAAAMTPVAAGEEPVVHLNPFEVSVSRNVGYQEGFATNTFDF